MKDAIMVSKYITGILSVDNLKLQKLLYYSQAVHLVINDKEPLFKDAIEAWRYGPVVPSVYHEYKRFGFENILTNIDEIEMLDLDLSEQEALDMVLSYYGEMSPMELVARTHKEKPWVDVYKTSENKRITDDALYSYFADVLDIQ